MDLNSPVRCLGRKTHWSISNRFNHSLIDGSSSCLNIIHSQCSGYYRAWYLLEMLHCAIIEKNSHLVRNEDDLKYFETILSAIAAHQYQKESWFSSNSKFVWTGSTHRKLGSKINAKLFRGQTNDGNRKYIDWRGLENREKLCFLRKLFLIFQPNVTYQ